MTTRQHSSFAIVFILGLLAMLMPLSIDMYLPALPVISAQFGVPAGSAQMTLSTYILGFALGQLIYGPMADSLGRKPVILGGTLVFAAAAGAAVACALAQTIDQLIVMRFFHGLAAAAASVVINALMRDIYPKEEFSRMMSFVMLVTTIAPLMAPIVGGWVLVWLSWHYIFWILAIAAILASVMIFALIKETLPVERRQPFHIRTTIGNFAALFRHKRVLSYMLASGFSFAGMFSFLSAGPFVYIEINHVPPQDFGYYFALNIVFLFVMTIINSRFVRRVGALNMFRAGLWIQFAMAVWMVFSALMGIGFWALVVGVAAFVGCVSMVSSNAMAVILDEFPHMAGTASSLAGTFRFGIGAIVGALLSLATFTSAWPMIWSIALCAACSILFYLYASRPKKRC
ncbi:bicyclomycin resistance protein [Salmonella enterica subsp. enterica serovar Bovismorbificans]|nr:bicyclomycin resistance protein [Salmonella enterica subsp. enterica serovar Bovismorbificans]